MYASDTPLAPSHSPLLVKTPTSCLGDAFQRREPESLDLLQLDRSRSKSSQVCVNHVTSPCCFVLLCVYYVLFSWRCSLMRLCESHLCHNPLVSTATRADKDTVSFLALQALQASLQVLTNLTNNNGQCPSQYVPSSYWVPRWAACCMACLCLCVCRLRQHSRRNGGWFSWNCSVHPPLTSAVRSTRRTLRLARLGQYLLYINRLYTRTFFYCISVYVYRVWGCS